MGGVENDLSVKRIAHILIGPTHITKLYLAAKDTTVSESSRTHLMRSGSALDRWAVLLKRVLGRSQLDFQSIQEHYYGNVRIRWISSRLGHRGILTPSLKLG